MDFLYNFMEFLVIIGKNNTFTIPAPVAKCYDLKRGDFVKFDLIKVIKKWAKTKKYF